MLKYLNKHRIYLLFIMFVSALYSYWLTSLPNSLFRDRENYLRYAQYSGTHLESIPKEFLLFYEPLFLVINEVLFFIFGNPQLNILIFVFLISFTFFFISFRKTKNFVFGLMLLLLLYFQIQTLALQLVTIRQGLGLIVLIYASLLFRKQRHIIYTLLICGLIHNSFIIVAFYYIVYLHIQRKEKMSKVKRNLIFVSFSLSFALLFFFLLNFVSSKQNYDNFEFSSGGGAFILWTLTLIYILFFKSREQKTFYEKLLYDFSIVGLVLYSTNYFLTPLSGRMIGSFIPFIGLLLLSETKLRDLLVFAGILLINVYLYINGAFEGFLLVSLKEFHSNLF